MGNARIADNELNYAAAFIAAVGHGRRGPQHMRNTLLLGKLIDKVARMRAGIASTVALALRMD